MKKQATERLSNSLQDRRLIIDEAVLEGMAPESPSRPLCTFLPWLRRKTISFYFLFFCCFFCLFFFNGFPQFPICPSSRQLRRLRVGSERACLLPCSQSYSLLFQFLPSSHAQSWSFGVGWWDPESRDREAGRKANVPGNCLLCALGPCV